MGNDMGKRRLAQAWRAEQQDVIQRFAPVARRRDEDFELVAHTLLPDIFVELARSQRALD
jgi:hypothetical protein